MLFFTLIALLLGKNNGNNNVTDSKMMIYIDTPKMPEYVLEANAVFESFIDYGYFANKKMDATLFKKSVFGLSGVNDFPIRTLEAFANSSFLVTRSQ